MFIFRVSEHISEIVQFISILLQNGFAYKIPQDGIYFDISKLNSLTTSNKEEEVNKKDELGDVRYGRYWDHSSPNVVVDNLDEEESNLNQKHNKKDFVLWKFTSSNNNEAKEEDMIDWDSEFGRGRPGWHIECSAMIESLFGQMKESSSSSTNLQISETCYYPPLDVHAGGVDLCFPHHTNEMAQSGIFLKIIISFL